MRGLIVLAVFNAVAGLGARAAEPRAGPEPWVTYPFNGKDLDGWEARDGKESANRWQVGKAEVDPDNPGQLVVKPGGSDLVNVVTRQLRGTDLVSKARWSDCRIEIEVMVPKGSNSGIYVMGTEIQVLDGINARTSPKGNMGAVYGRRGPSYFPAKWLELDYHSKDKAKEQEWTAWMKSDEYTKCVSKVLKPPGEWQKFVIEFELSKTDPATKTTMPARFRRVELNGVVIHENVELEKGAHSRGMLLLQGNHGPVAYRNIKVTPLEGEKQGPSTGGTKP
jgi:hypothetical protein